MRPKSAPVLRASQKVVMVCLSGVQGQNTEKFSTKSNVEAVRLLIEQKSIVVLAVCDLGIWDTMLGWLKSEIARSLTVTFQRQRHGATICDIPWR